MASNIDCKNESNMKENKSVNVIVKYLEKTNDKVYKRSTKKKVIILADQRGRGLRNEVQRLLGDKFEVECFLKPRAALGNILDSIRSSIGNLTMHDFVIVLCGINDKNPDIFQINLHLWFCSVTNTNIVMCGIPNNTYLDEMKLNYVLKFICTKYENVTFLDVSHNVFSVNIKSKIILARLILKEILHLEYK
ncbi:unnamed protein product [Chilo suppressalis]|uniref:Centromere protein M n=1 Tax=Chilo suppressalis TaxID=168631 RepID=A0ABN8APK6_CHISP|nr:unnamed protein product [Chilo suppressalis]